MNPKTNTSVFDFEHFSVPEIVVVSGAEATTWASLAGSGPWTLQELTQATLTPHVPDLDLVGQFSDPHLDPDGLHVDLDEAELRAGMAGPPVLMPAEDRLLDRVPEPSNPHLTAARDAFFLGARSSLSCLMTAVEDSSDKGTALQQIADLAGQMKGLGEITLTEDPHHPWQSQKLTRSVLSHQGTPSGNANANAAVQHIVDGAEKALLQLLKGFEPDNAMHSLAQIRLLAGHAAELTRGLESPEAKEEAGSPTVYQLLSGAVQGPWLLPITKLLVRNGINLQVTIPIEPGKSLQYVLRQVPMTNRTRKRMHRLLEKGGANLHAPPGPSSLSVDPLASSSTASGNAQAMQAVQAINWQGNSIGSSNSVGETSMNPHEEALELPINPDGGISGAQSRETQGVKMLTELIAGIVGLNSGRALEGDINAYRAAKEAGLDEEAERIKVQIDARIAGETPGIDARAVAETLITASSGGKTPDEIEGFDPETSTSSGVSYGDDDDYDDDLDDESDVPQFFQSSPGAVPS